MKLKKEYQLSIWEDFMDNTSKPGISFINERKVCDIGSNILDNPRAAYNVVFKSKTDGTHELTFDINSRYWDQDTQDFIDNPIRPYLYNEAKVKLHYKNKWYDFLIKNCQENSKEKKFSYTCKDLYIDELGRNGYSAEFSTELGGNVGDVTELAAVALEGSDWTVAPFESDAPDGYDGPYSDMPIQKISEVVYAYQLPTGTIQYCNINDNGSDGEEEALDATTTKPIIYILYSCAHDSNLEGKDYQFYYEPSGKYEVDDDGNFINTKPKYIKNLSDDLKDNGKLRLQYTNETHTFVPEYRGYRYVQAQKTEWLNKIERQVKLYKDNNGNIYYGYQKTKYLSPEIAQNVLINTGPIFDGTTGWIATSYDEKTQTIIERKLAIQNGCELNNNGGYDFRDISNNNIYVEGGGGATMTNLAFKTNLKNIGGLTKDERWVFRYKKNSIINTIQMGSDDLCSIENWSDNDPQILDNTDIYVYKLITINESKSYNELLNNPIFFNLATVAFYGGDLFRYYTYIDNNKNEILITPETKIESQNLIKNEYYFFTKEAYDACNTEQDLVLSFVSNEELKTANGTELQKMYHENFKKIALIEIKESNYFNILQTLNEKFECWVDFQIEHDTNGTISTNENGKRIKRVVFKNYIGKDNWSGFKYGINLDSIQRTVNSDEITTKTIVKANSNEFAQNGSCNIARAKSNFSGSQSLINLEYFSRLGILKQSEVDSDFYVNEDGYLGYYTRLRALNEALQTLELKLISIESALIGIESTIQASAVTEQDFLEDINAVNNKLANEFVTFDAVYPLNTPVHPVFNSNDDDNRIFYKKDGKWCYRDTIYFYNYRDDYYLTSSGASVVYHLEHGKELVDNYNTFLAKHEKAKEDKRIVEEEKAKLIAFRDGEYSYIDIDGKYRRIIFEDNKWYEVLSEPLSLSYETSIEQNTFTVLPFVLNFIEGKKYQWSFYDSQYGYFSEQNNEQQPIQEKVVITSIAEKINLGNKEYIGIKQKGYSYIEQDYSAEVYILYDKETKNNYFLINSLHSDGILDRFEIIVDYSEVNIEGYPLLSSIKQLDKDFYAKYSRFIREGTWTSEDYTDDELYYLDACSVAYTSSRPKVTYSISVVDIKNSIVPEDLGYDYSNYDFECGDLTTIEDTEFFGWTYDVNGNKKSPYKELVLISEIQETLDNYSNSKITVQNYKTQFDDLFQRIAATTQSLELKQGEYNHASKMVTTNAQAFVQKTLTNNNILIDNVNSGVHFSTEDENGIITIDLNNPSLITRIVGGAILISNTGGNTWSTGISGEGINASVINTGHLNTANIQIYNNNEPAFSWNEFGINGFDKTPGGNYDYSKYTRMDRFGFYAVDGAVDFKPFDDEEVWTGREATVNIPYCLTKKGLRLGMGDNSIRLEKDSTNNNEWTIFIGKNTKIVNGELDIDFGDLDMNLTAKNIKFTNDNGEEITSVTMGTGDYAIRVVKDNDNVFSVNYNGELVAKKGIIGNWNIDDLGLSGVAPNVGQIRIGRHEAKFTKLDSNNQLIEDTTRPSVNSWISITENAGQTYQFMVTARGNLIASGAEISGKITATSGEFNGVVNATSGNFSDKVTIGGTTLTAYTLREFYRNSTNNEGGVVIKNAEIIKGSIGGFKADSNSLSSNGFAEENSVFMCTGTEGSYRIGEHNDTGWCFGAGKKFGVTKDGSVYGTSINITYRDIINNEFYRIQLEGLGITKTSLNANDKVTTSTTISWSSLMASNTFESKYANGKYGSLFSRSFLYLSGAYGNYTHYNGMCSNGYGKAFFAGGTDVKGDSANFRVAHSGQVYYSSLEAGSSDINKKNSISTLSDNYEILFDNLSPCLYKYNNGTSNRYHTGFIAQHVKKAMDKALLSTEEFAGLVIDKYLNDKNEEVEEWFLRYGEFISLNTWQIQKLKTRVSVLENEIKLLKQNLKSSQNSDII